MRDYLDHAMRDAGCLELRHHDGDRWVSGQFDDLCALRRAIADRADRGNLYATLNRPKRSWVPNDMTASALCDDDMEVRTRIVFDFDPERPRGQASTDAEVALAVAARDKLVAALLGMGWPMPATAMSGNGAHAVYRVRMPVTPETSEMLTRLYRGLKSDFETPEVHFDTTVRNPARIWRLYGTQNRKGTPTPDRPHRTAVARIPGRWEAVSPRQVEALAASYAKRAMPTPPRPAAARVDGQGDFSTLDAVRWFAAHGSYRRHLDGGKHAVACPWEGEHSTAPGPMDTSTVIWEADRSLWPTFYCSHAHCDGRGIREVMSLWRDADAFCARAWRAES